LSVTQAVIKQLLLQLRCCTRGCELMDADSWTWTCDLLYSQHQLRDDSAVQMGACRDRPSRCGHAVCDKSQFECSIGGYGNYIVFISSYHYFNYFTP